jgi:uncharacterized protein YndB with AHSA1/START domain
MTPVDKTPPGQTHTLSFTFELHHAPEKVWRALTEPALLRQWLLPIAQLELAPGAAFQFQTDPHPGWDGTVHCQLLEAEPQKKLSYTWIVGDMDTVVTFTLSPSTTGTLLSLVHSGFKPTQKQNFGGARYGWNLMGNKLIDVLATSDMSEGVDR